MTVTWIILCMVSSMATKLLSGMHLYICFPCFQTIPFTRWKMRLPIMMTDITQVDIIKSRDIITNVHSCLNLHRTPATNLDHQHRKPSALMARTKGAGARPQTTKPDQPRPSRLINDSYSITHRGVVR